MAANLQENELVRVKSKRGINYYSFPGVIPHGKCFRVVRRAGYGEVVVTPLSYDDSGQRPEHRLPSVSFERI